MTDRGRAAASRSQDRSARSQREERRRISMPSRSGAAAGWSHLYRLLLGAAPLLAALALAEAPGTGPGWALTPMPANATGVPARAAAADPAGAAAQAPAHGAIQAQAPAATAGTAGNGKTAATALAGEDTARTSANGGEAAGSGQARLSRAEVPAAGRQEIILSVERFGRYSVRAASRQGTAGRVIDRMAGELGEAGEAGHENGRLDLFLDRGDYQVVTESHQHGEGAAKLSVIPFRGARDSRGATAAAGAATAAGATGTATAPRAPGGTRAAGTTSATRAATALPSGQRTEHSQRAQPPQGSQPAAAVAPELVERKLVAESLDDLRQLSYWLRLAARREVRLEAAGRNLADLRLWRDGSWLEDVAPSCGAIQPVTGQPLLRCEIAATLPAGLYLVTLYGGLPQPWSEDAAEHPLYLRWGYPLLADAGRRRYQVGPFGEDRFELPANVNYVRIELPQARPARLTAGWASSGRLLSELAGADAATAEVKKSSVPPVAAVRMPARPSGGRHEQAGRRSGGGSPPPAPRRARPAI